MKRKFIYIAAAWGMGLLFISFLPTTYDLLIVPVAFILLALMRFLCKFKLQEICTVLSVFAIAAAFYRIYDIAYYQKIIAFNNKEISFSGKILEIKEYSKDKASYLVKGKINDIPNVEITVYADAYYCNINDYFEFSGVVKNFDNDYLFNSKDYYKSKGIFLTCDKTEFININKNNNFSLTRILNDYREKVTGFIKKNLTSDESSMLCGMLFGDKSGMSQDDKTLFYRTGIGHVMAVSGLHLVLFCSLFSAFFKSLRLRKVTSFVFLEVIMILFAVCSGLSKSVLRAMLMMTLVNAAPLFYRKSDTLNSISIAFIILTLPCPFLIRNPSLILSLAGAFSAGVFAPFITEKLKDNTFVKKQIKNAAYIFLVSLGMLPFSVIFFGESSLFSPIANIVLTPICMIALLSGLVASITVFLEPVFLVKFSGFLCRIVMSCVRFIGKLKFSGINFGDEMRYIFAGILILLVLVYLIFKNRKYSVISIFISVAVVISFVVFKKLYYSDEIKIAVLGNNKADVIVIAHENYNSIIDISGRNNNYRYALKFLQENNIDKIDEIFIKERQYQAMSTYSNGLNLIDTERIVFPTDTIIRHDTKLLGKTPEYSDYKYEDLQHDNIHVNINDNRVLIEYGDFKFVCDSGCNDSIADVYAEYDNIFDPPVCSFVIAPEYENIDDIENVITQSNVIIKAENNGKFSVGGL